MSHSETRIGLRVLRISLHSLLKVSDSFVHCLRISFGKKVSASKIVFIGFGIYTLIRCTARRGLQSKIALYFACYFAGRVALHSQDIVNISLERVGPNMLLWRDPEQLDRDADMISRSPDCAFYQRVHIEFATDLRSGPPFYSA